jgi:hypothetical protein
MGEDIIEDLEEEQSVSTFQEAFSGFEMVQWYLTYFHLMIACNN